MTDHLLARLQAVSKLLPPTPIPRFLKVDPAAYTLMRAALQTRPRAQFPNPIDDLLRIDLIPDATLEPGCWQTVDAYGVILREGQFDPPQEDPRSPHGR